MKIKAINDESLIIQFDDQISLDNHQKVKQYLGDLKDVQGILSLVPSYNSVLVVYDIELTDFEELKERISQIRLLVQEEGKEVRMIHIPVCYENELGPDIERVADLCKISKEEVINKHTECAYLVYMLGFTPGFPYLGGLDPLLETPRLETPRLRIEAGSVGIGGKQTGIYPLATPGGWNIIGQTPLKLFDGSTSETLLSLGDYIKFESINIDEFKRIEMAIGDKTYQLEVSYERI